MIELNQQEEYVEEIRQQNNRGNAAVQFLAEARQAVVVFADFLPKQQRVVLKYVIELIYEVRSQNGRLPCARCFPSSVVR